MATRRRVERRFFAEEDLPADAPHEIRTTLSRQNGVTTGSNRLCRNIELRDDIHHPSVVRQSASSEHD